MLTGACCYLIPRSQLLVDSHSREIEKAFLFAPFWKSTADCCAQVEANIKLESDLQRHKKVFF